MGHVTSPALRYHGTKFRLAPWVLQHFPDHRCYVEPFAGAAGLAEIGFVATTIKAAKHYSAGDVPRILAAMVKYRLGVMTTA